MHWKRYIVICFLRIVQKLANPKEFRVLSKDEVIDEMGVGTNLGNTLDGHSGFTPSETAWQGQVTTKKYMKALHDAGYNTVRIPVTWGNMINDDGSIKESLDESCSGNRRLLYFAGYVCDLKCSS